MKVAKATKFHRKFGERLEIDPEEDPSAVGAALTEGSAVPRTIPGDGLI